MSQNYYLARSTGHKCWIVPTCHSGFTLMGALVSTEILLWGICCYWNIWVFRWGLSWWGYPDGGGGGILMGNHDEGDPDEGDPDGAILMGGGAILIGGGYPDGDHDMGILMRGILMGGLSRWGILIGGSWWGGSWWGTSWWGTSWWGTWRGWTWGGEVKPFSGTYSQLILLCYDTFSEGFMWLHTCHNVWCFFSKACLTTQSIIWWSVDFSQCSLYHIIIPFEDLLHLKNKTYSQIYYLLSIDMIQMVLNHKRYYTSMYRLKLAKLLFYFSPQQF